MSIENASLNTGSCSGNAPNILLLLFSSLLVFSIIFSVLIAVEYTLACYWMSLPKINQERKIETEYIRRDENGE